MHNGPAAKRGPADDGEYTPAADLGLQGDGDDAIEIDDQSEDTKE